MKKKIVSILLYGLFAICIPVSAADFETATEAVKNMGVGWNLGNTLDANDPTKTWMSTEQHETCWEQPVTTSALLKMMKQAGFGAIRVPVTWYQEMDADGKVNEAWMNRVKEVVDYVIDNGMYCILNVHHDTGADGGNFKSWIKASTKNYTTNKSKYEYLWQQIAEKFKDYDQHLLFEAYNEMLDEQSKWSEPTDATDGYKAINNYAQSFVNIVRATGSNNTQRNLVINTYSASNSAAAMKAMELPETSGHIAFQIHNYPDWQSESHARELVDNLISSLKTNLISKGAPVIIGEYATLSVWPERDWYQVDKAVALYAMDYFIKKTKEEGIGTFYWMGMSDGVSRSMPAFNQADLAKTIIKAYHGSLEGFQFPTTDNFQTEYEVKYSSDWGELFLYGDWNSTTGLKLSEYKGIRIVLDQDSYAGKLQVKVYGDKDGKNADGTDKYKEQVEQLVSGSTSTTITFDAAQLGTSFCRITLQTMAKGQTATVKEATLIKTDGTEVAGAVSVGWGCEMTAKSTPAGIIQVALPPYKDDRIYNLRGQQVTNPGRGIYIKNGKKYILK